MNKMMKASAWLLILAMLSAILLVSCSDESGKDTDTQPEITDPPTGAVTDAPTEAELPTETPTEPETEEETAPMIDISGYSDLDKMVTPFWRTNVMYNEMTSFIVREDGSITAKLLFKPTKITSVKSNDLKTEYKEGVDYTWDGSSNTLVWKDGSAIKYFTQNDIHGKDENGNYIPEYPNWDSLSRSRFGDQLYCVAAFLYEKQIQVTYEYEYGAWDGPVTSYQGDLLPKTMEKLKNDEDINIVFWGDSIFTGCDSSKMYNRDPMQESFPDFVKEVLEEKFGLHVRRYNPSVGGKDSAWGVSDVQLVIDKEPDLVFIGFGMNDGGKSGREVGKNIEKIMEKIKEQCPDCEFVVVCSMVPNKDAGFLSTHTQFPKVFEKMQGEGVAYVDMFNFHSKLLETKDFISMSGNNINHPNDWLIRCYTMNMLSVLIDYDNVQ